MSQYDKFLPASATPTTVSPEKHEKTTESKKREKKSSAQSKTQATPNWDKYYELADFKGGGPQQYEMPPLQWIQHPITPPIPQYSQFL